MSAFVNALCTPLLIFHAVMVEILLGANVNSGAEHFPAGPCVGWQGWRRGRGSVLLLSEAFFPECLSTLMNV